MGVVGVDSVVVEGWSSGFLVGLVLVSGEGGYFGELARLRPLVWCNAC